ncbi:hypothetical protein OG800_23190 [Streptomyces sp. NBC_00445]|uniref:hypothetical protein n=1 Tax=Streptomyces sp. NBC_00445 TaxID=2975745 RepID=UPI002E24D0A2
MVGAEKWSLGTGELSQVLWPDDTDPPFRLPADEEVAALTRDGRYLATGNRSGTVTVHDLVAREQVGRLALHGAITWSCLPKPGSTTAACTTGAATQRARF